MDEDFVEAVLAVVEQIPAGRVMSYGDIAEYLGRSGPRLVGAVMSRHGAGVPWWRVVRADGHPVRGLEDRALGHLIDDDTPLRGDRVDMARASHTPGVPPPDRPRHA